jgi:hypothetical protein
VLVEKNNSRVNHELRFKVGTKNWQGKVFQSNGRLDQQGTKLKSMHDSQPTFDQRPNSY